jgi:GTP-binding protein HflX
MVEDKESMKDLKADKTVKISAKTGEGIKELQDVLEEILKNRKVYLEHTFSYQDAGHIQTIRKYGQLISEEYTEGGILVKAYIPKDISETILSKIKVTVE